VGKLLVERHSVRGDSASGWFEGRKGLIKLGGAEGLEEPVEEGDAANAGGGPEAEEPFEELLALGARWPIPKIRSKLNVRIGLKKMS
jgi:hypothetical protein